MLIFFFFNCQEIEVDLLTPSHVLSIAALEVYYVIRLGIIMSADVDGVMMVWYRDKMDASLRQFLKDFSKNGYKRWLKVSELGRSPKENQTGVMH